MGWPTVAFIRVNSSVLVSLWLLPQNLSLSHIYAFTPLPKTHDNSDMALFTLEKSAVKNESYLVWSSWSHLHAGHWGKQGAGEGEEREKEREREKEMSANYSVQQAKLQRRLVLSPAPLKNDGVPFLHWGLRIVPVKKETSFINPGTWNAEDRLPSGSKVCTTCTNICPWFKIQNVDKEMM